MATVPVDEANEYFHRYIALAEDGTVEHALTHSKGQVLATLAQIDEDKAGYRYAAGKWSIKELLQHIIDCERIFLNRAVRIARMDGTPMPGFDENDYASNSKADARPWADIVEEYELNRASSLAFFKGLDDDQLKAKGTANTVVLSVRAIGYLCAGHELHHNNVLCERYL